MKIKLYIGIVIFIGVAAQCPRDMYLSYPDYFPKPNYNWENNPYTEAKIQLGRALFYDPLLSKDGTISCASCHSPYNAFAHTDHKLSHGINDSIGTRNAPALFNLAWQSSFMWDGAVNHLDMQALAPITDLKEMGETLVNVVDKLQKSDIYPSFFAEAYGDSTVTGEHVLKALSQFQLTLVSDNSRYDKMRNSELEFNPQEENGYKIFKKHCNNCHTEPMFTNYTFASNGISMDTVLNDVGRYTVTNIGKDSLQFKVPSLRNLSYSYPYMHDGRFRKLRQVIDHYTGDIQQVPYLSKALQSGISLTSNEKTDLIAFLLSLNDLSFVRNKKNHFPREILLN